MHYTVVGNPIRCTKAAEMVMSSMQLPSARPAMQMMRMRLVVRLMGLIVCTNGQCRSLLHTTFPSTLLNRNSSLRIGAPVTLAAYSQHTIQFVFVDLMNHLNILA